MSTTADAAREAIALRRVRYGKTATEPVAPRSAMYEHQPLPTEDTIKSIIRGKRRDCCDLCGEKYVYLHNEPCKGCGPGFSPLCNQCVFFPERTLELIKAGAPAKNAGICAHCVLEIKSKNSFWESKDPDNMQVLGIAKNNVEFITRARKLDKIWSDAEIGLQDEARLMRQDKV